MPAATLKINIIADATQAAATMDKASTRAGKFGSGLRKAALPAAAVIAGLGAMGKAAADDQRGQAILANQLRKTAGATQAQVAASEDWITQTALATGVADDQLRPALAALARATGDVGKSQGDMGIALDVAAATGKDVTSVADAMAKGYAGNTGALGKLLPGLDKATVKSGDMKKIMGEMARMTGGTAAKAADTASGKMQRAALAMNEMKETAGTALLPVLSKLGDMLGGIAAWAQKNQGAFKAIVIVLGLLAGAILVLNGVVKVVTILTEAWSIAQAIFNAIMDANPIVLIIIGIIALIAVIVLAYKKSATFRAIVQGAFRAIAAAGKAVVNALAAAWRWLWGVLKAVWAFIWANVISPLIDAFRLAKAAAGVAADLIGKAWDGLKSALNTVWQWVKTHVFDPMKAAFDAVVDAVKTVIDWIKKINIPGPVQKLIDLGKGLFIVAPAPGPAPAPTVGGRTAATRAAGPGAAAGGSAADVTLAAITPQSQVVVQVSDRKLAQLVDVSIRATATSAARNLTRRRMVTV